MTPSQRALNLYRQMGYLCQSVARWNHFAGASQDLWGIIDIIAVRANVKGTLYCQVTSRTNHATRIKKILNTPIVTLEQILGGNRIHVMSWEKERMGKRRITSFSIRENKVELSELDTPDDDL